MKIERIDIGVYQITDTTSTHDLTVTSDELMYIYDFVLLNYQMIRDDGAQATQQEQEE